MYIYSDDDDALDPPRNRVVPVLRFPPKIQLMCQRGFMSWDEAALLMEIVHLAKDAGHCEVTAAYFAGEHVGRRTIKRRLSALLRLGYITTIRQGGLPNRVTPDMQAIYAPVPSDEFVFPLWKD